ncbi:MAG: MFS transporter [Prevotellamassilia sp.]|uniref:MFS transporter n=1 Tax=Prevotellamassilia timonensis TaxID=1852370 RepID=UPI001D961028|nr:MFS transporter [Prevotellamassilia timonensis]MBS7395532.1 MFS transporter [Prevotellamassilia sp.]MCI5508556.1 MFS transporter [Bacteroidales bacterium]MDY2975103.1 MFS transporter [Alloprevotella sp.]MCF2635696.1 MFS transporter [Prevotellamassilia timonensis]MDD6538312.1 MFS transporter [Bacteroidales bacterium]
MSNQQKQWGAIVVMIALFAMIAFVTNLCTPMATIIKNQGEISNVLAQIGNYGNFVAYLLMGIPAGMLISKFGYKKTALIGLVVGIIGILIQWFSGQLDAKENLGLVFGVYLAGAFIAGLCMCILNCVVNPMLNILGGGGNKGNQLIQLGGVFNSTAAVACYILMGALIADATKAKIDDATPALMIALAIFVVAFVVICFTKIEEPEQAPVQVELIKEAMSYRHFALGALAIFLYMGIEVGVPNFVNLYLIETGIPAGTVGMLVAVYWFMMLIGRLVGASIGGKVSSRVMITTVSITTLVLVLFGMFAPTNITVNFPGVDWGKLELIWQEVPLGIFAFLLVGLCTSVMWGGIFNMAVEGLGKYTAIASGIFMTMVFGCAVMMFIQASVADATDYITSFWVVVFCAAYILFYALIGSRVNKRA